MIRLVSRLLRRRRPPPRGPVVVVSGAMPPGSFVLVIDRSVLKKGG